MKHRLTKITTKTGDDGTTGLADGTRLAKDQLRIISLGEIDETNSVIGLIAVAVQQAEYLDLLITIQHDLFDLGGELSLPGCTVMTPSRVQWIEGEIERYNTQLPALSEFILPGGSALAASAHFARTVSRRAERAVIALNNSEPPNRSVSPIVRQYLNRLSDLLFVLSRIFNRDAQCIDVYWQKGRCINS